MEGTIRATVMFRQEQGQVSITPATDRNIHPSHLSSGAAEDVHNVSLVEMVRGLKDEVGGLHREIRELRDQLAVVKTSREVEQGEVLARVEEIMLERKKSVRDDDHDGERQDSGQHQYQGHIFAEEFHVGLSDKLRLVNLSARAIEVLNDVTMRCSWSICSANTYGFLIRNLLLRGSTYKKQLVEDTSKLLFLSFMGVLFSAAMQFILSYYLFWKMPGYFDSDGKERERTYASGGHAPLPSYLFSGVMYETANDVCRTQQIVQLICVGLFLFYVLNNVPGIIKNTLIIAYSERFISTDEEEITKLHYWRESDFSRKTEENDQARTSFIKSTYQRVASVEKFCHQCFNKLRSVGSANHHHCDKCLNRIQRGSEEYRCEECKITVCAHCFVPFGNGVMQEEYILPGFRTLNQPSIIQLVQSLSPKNLFHSIQKPVACENLPASFFEVTDMRNFLGEVLQDLHDEKREHVELIEDLSFADRAKVNLVRVDYLRPNVESYPAWTILIPFFHFLKSFCPFKTVSGLDQPLRLAAESEARVKMLSGDMNKMGQNPESPASADSKLSTDDLYKRSPKMFKDLPYFVELFPFNFTFAFSRWMAFIFGVLPELVSLAMVTITGIQYILWSGYKIDSDSQGIEEIILATVAITFIYDIDEAIYDHILPEYYKEAHERDRFELIGWMPLASVQRFPLLLSWDFNCKMFFYSAKNLLHTLFGTAAPDRIGHTSVGGSAEEHEENNTRQKVIRMVKEKWQMQHGNAKKAPQWNNGNIPMSEETAFSLSADDYYNDYYLALRYPFLYAQKFQTVFQFHIWEKFLVSYSTRGLHYFVLVALTLAIVGKYRLDAQCDRFAPKDASPSIWATQEWPTTCLISMGTAANVGSKITDLYQNVNGMVAPVSCVKKGYLPSNGPDGELATQEESEYFKQSALIPDLSE